MALGLYSVTSAFAYRRNAVRRLRATSSMTGEEAVNP
jgi:hypothetical protein